MSWYLESGVVYSQPPVIRLEDAGSSRTRPFETVVTELLGVSTETARHLGGAGGI